MNPQYFVVIARSLSNARRQRRCLAGVLGASVPAGSTRAPSTAFGQTLVVGHRHVDAHGRQVVVAGVVGL